MEDIVVEYQGALCLITFNRPAKKNAITFAMYQLLTDALEAAQQNKSVRAILLSGSEDCFTSGNDIQDFMAQKSLSGDALPPIVFLKALAQCNKPIIACVSGLAIGIGTTLLLHCDFVYAASKTQLQMPFVSLGLCAEGASSLLIPQIVGPTLAAKWLLAGEAFSANDALDAGLINGVGESYEAAFTMAMSTCEKISKQPAAAVRATKALMRGHQMEQILKTLDDEAMVFAQRLASPEAKEAMTAFMQRREPNFTQFD